ncbi:hypothetical protein TKK_0010863 [Trichogramma kaykai]
MSESVTSSSSRTELSKAFERARLRFPKNFGLENVETHVNNNYESKELSACPVTAPESINHISKSLVDNSTPLLVEEPPNSKLESTLIDLMNNVEISCSLCSLSNNSKKSLQETAPKPKIVENTDRDEEFSDIIMKKYDDVSIYKTVNYWKEDSDRNNDQESDIDSSARLSENSRKFYYKELRRRDSAAWKKKHRGHRPTFRRASPLKYNSFCEDENKLHSSDCPYYNLYSSSQQCHNSRHKHHLQHQHCCCHSYCCYDCCHSRCCNKCSLDGAFQRRSKRSNRSRLCSSCKRRDEHRVPSRDSGVFSNCVHDDEIKGSLKGLRSKDSLTLMQSKYRSSQKNCAHRYSRHPNEETSFIIDEDDSTRYIKHHAYY